jgi:hypothetical protein
MARVPHRKRFPAVLLAAASLPASIFSFPASAAALQQQPADDVSSRHAQLESLEKASSKMQRDAHLAKEKRLQTLRERNERLTLDVQKILQLSMDLNQSIEQGKTPNSAQPVEMARDVEKLAHEVRTKLAEREVAHPARRKNVSATPAGRDELRQQSRQCLQLALKLKQQVDQLLDPQNQNTVSVAGLKAAKSKVKGNDPAAPIMLIAEDIENLSYRISQSL